MTARTIPWESIADWYKDNEQMIRDVMKFEGLRGAVNEVLRIAPDQPELAALREELAGLQSSCAIDRRHLDRMIEHSDDLQQRLTAAEQRNAKRDIESAAKVLANCMDDPWDHMPENGRALMRKHAKDGIDAALPQPTESGASE